MQSALPVPKMTVTYVGIASLWTILLRCCQLSWYEYMERLNDGYIVRNFTAQIEQSKPWKLVWNTWIITDITFSPLRSKKQIFTFPVNGLKFSSVPTMRMLTTNKKTFRVYFLHITSSMKLDSARFALFWLSLVTMAWHHLLVHDKTLLNVTPHTSAHI